MYVVCLCSGVAQLAEVLHGMPHLTALAIEGALLDADEDWLRDMAGLMRHGRWGVESERSETRVRWLSICVVLMSQWLDTFGMTGC